MRRRFRATETSCYSDEDLLSCGITGTDSSGNEQSLGFERSSETSAIEEPDEDWGVHACFNDQAFGEYNALSRVQLSRELLVVDLSKQLGQLEGVEGFDIVLAIDDASFDELRQLLTRIFRGMDTLITP
jgi:hypothetical protein